MNDVQEVAVLRVGDSAGELPLSDWAVSRLLDCCCRTRSDWPTEISQDPSLACWIAARLPREASLGDITACIDSMAGRKPMQLLFSSSVATASIDGELWRAFQSWWRREAVVAHLARQELRTEIAAVIPILCQLTAPSPLPEALQASTRPFEFVSNCDADQEVVRAIGRVRDRLRDDDRLVEQCLPAEQHSRVDRVLNSLHRLLPKLIEKLAALQELSEGFDERLEQEKLLSMKELAYGASHEINNPLANISSRAQVLLRDEADPERRRSLATINSQAFRAHEMIADMMLFAKPPALEFSQLNPKQFLDSVVAEFSRELPSSIQLGREDVDPVPTTLAADPIQLTVAIQAICVNAVEAMAGQGQLVIRLRQTHGDWKHGQSMIEIEIQDDGPGIAAEVRRHLFDPFYSGREAGRGLGFGLSKAWRIVQLHGGQIVVDSQGGEGAKFTLCLPVDRGMDLGDSG